MPKIDFSSSTVPEIVSQKCEFPSSQGTVTMFLKPLKDRITDMVQTRKRDLVARYVTGGWIDGEGNYQEKPDVYVMKGDLLPLVDGLNEITLQKIARVELMQSGRPEDKYNLDDLVLIMEKEGSTWDEIVTKCVEIQMGYVPGKAWPVPSEKPTTQPLDTASST